ncbi:aromatic acid exporter family protein [Actinoplanes sp. KI2]|uniref:aromatic acid exporter family protein n=1 Tax=Actinoplanes sp. KI2 TaxID=2983315 RepID=UPI0021D5B69A|nr:aromatic acid exporter family protein [Actinoplanes sp. KI2]MCU7730814.1 aromatic acid exporter family protein [Actinoplanes sp. KI2]
MRLTSFLRRPRTAVLARSGRIPGIQTAKVTLAAVVAYVAADLLNTTATPILAPLTAILVVQVTVYQTVTEGLQRVLSVLAGVLVAVGLATVVGLSWWSLGIVVAVSLVLGQVLRLGPHTLEVPISAMLVLAVGGAAASQAATGRVYETLIGAATGIAVNFAIAPPVHVESAGSAVAGLATRLGDFLRSLAAQLRAGWSRQAAQDWLTAARSLSASVLEADQSLVRAEQSAVLNPRGGEVRVAQPRLRTALTAIEYCTIVVRALCREIFDRTFYLPPELEQEAYPAAARQALADVLDLAAAALDGVAAVATDAEPVDTTRARVAAQLDQLYQRREQLGRLLLVDPHADAAAWQQHGALLTAVDRLRVEIEAAIRPATQPWRPPSLTERPRRAAQRVVGAAEQTLPLVTDRSRQAVRRMMDVAADAAAEHLAGPDPRAARPRRDAGAGTPAEQATDAAAGIRAAEEAARPSPRPGTSRPETDQE